MERLKEVKECLGVRNLEIVIDSIRDGHTVSDNIKMIAISMSVMEMSTRAYGVVVHNSRESPEVIFRKVLDCWYNDYLFKHKENGLEKFLDILNSHDVNLKELASTLENNKSGKSIENSKSSQAQGVGVYMFVLIFVNREVPNFFDQ